MTHTSARGGRVLFLQSRITGKERDSETNLDYFGARYYASNMGRFTSPDDGSDQNPGDPQSWNLYSYVRNNPLSNTDPTGNACVNGKDDNSGGESCADVAKADAEYARQHKASATVYANDGSQEDRIWELSYRISELTRPHSIAELVSNAGQDAIAFEGARGIVSGTISLLGSPAKIKISAQVLRKLATVHAGKMAGKSAFAAGEDVASLVKAAEGASPSQSPNGYFVRVLDAGHVVGTDARTGAQTTVYTVVTDSSNNLVTAHPGAPKSW